MAWHRINLVLELKTIYERHALEQQLKHICNEFAGPDNWRYYGAFTKTPYDLCFKHEADLLYFKLTYC